MPVSFFQLGGPIQMKGRSPISRTISATAASRSSMLRTNSSLDPMQRKMYVGSNYRMKALSVTVFAQYLEEELYQATTSIVWPFAAAYCDRR